MQNPVGAEFNFDTMRMELTDFWAVVFNPDAQAKFVHTVSAGYVTASVFVLAISSWYLLQAAATSNSPSAASASPRRSASRRPCSVIVLGDESGYTVGEAQQTKLAAMEAMWETEPAPRRSQRSSPITNEKEMKNDWEIKIPWVMGLIGTRSVDQAADRHQRSARKNRERIISGIKAVQRARGPAPRPERRAPRKPRSRRTRPTSASACC